MTGKATLLSGTVERSRAHGYHILGEDRIAYAANLEDWHDLALDYHAAERRLLIGQRVQFVPSERTNPRGLPYADNIITPLADMLKAQERSDAETRAIALYMNPNYIFPEDSDS